MLTSTKNHTKFVWQVFRVNIQGMKQITITVEESALEWAEIEAANRDCSVSRLLGQLLEESMRRDVAYSEALQGWMISHEKAEPIVYADLNARQKENYNFHKVSAVLAEFGFTSIRLSDDWKGADFLALHKDGEKDLKVQLKGVYTLDKDYLTKNIWICFRHARTGAWYLYPHDEALKWALDNTNLANTSWPRSGLWTNRAPSKILLAWLSPYVIPTK